MQKLIPTLLLGLTLASCGLAIPAMAEDAPACAVQTVQSAREQAAEVKFTVTEYKGTAAKAIYALLKEMAGIPNELDDTDEIIQLDNPANGASWVGLAKDGCVRVSGTIGTEMFKSLIESVLKDAAKDTTDGRKKL